MGRYRLGQLSLTFVAVFCGTLVVVYVADVLKAAKRRRDNVPLAHLCLHNALAMLLQWNSIWKEAPMLTMLVVGMDACSMITKMNFHATTQARWPRVHVDALPFVVVATVQVAGHDLGVGAFGLVLAWQILWYVAVWYDTVTRI